MIIKQQLGKIVRLGNVYMGAICIILLSHENCSGQAKEMASNPQAYAVTSSTLTSSTDNIIVPSITSLTNQTPPVDLNIPNDNIKNTDSDPQADAMLQKIVEDTQTLFGELEDLKITTTVPPAYEEKILAIQKRYQAFVSAYPKHLYGKILLGKFLQKINEPELANQQFLNANDLNPNIAVVKQQLGNYLTEHGEYALATPYFLSAIELEPKVAIYHYQLGELLSTYRTFFLRDKIYTPEVLDKQMLEAFSNSAKLDPSNRTFQVRYAESFFDVAPPNYSYALKLWNKLLETSQNPLEQQFLLLRKAQVLIELKEYKNARILLNQSFDVRYERSRKALLDKIEQAAPSTALPSAINDPTYLHVSTSTPSQT